jgi:hypothetical protein
VLFFFRSDGTSGTGELRSGLSVYPLSVSSASRCCALIEPGGALAGFEPDSLPPDPEGALAGFEPDRDSSEPGGALAGFES